MPLLELLAFDFGPERGRIMGIAASHDFEPI